MVERPRVAETEAVILLEPPDDLAVLGEAPPFRLRDELRRRPAGLRLDVVEVRLKGHVPTSWPLSLLRRREVEKVIAAHTGTAARQDGAATSEACPPQYFQGY